MPMKFYLLLLLSACKQTSEVKVSHLPHDFR